MSDFVHLHLHTEFSLLDGACRVEELLDQAQKLGMPALAVTEHGNMFSAVTFHDYARKKGVKPILGCEVYVAPGDRRTKSGTPGETANHLVLLAETNEGFHNLIKLVSSGYTEGFYYKPRIDKDLLAQHSKGLIGLSSCLKGEVAEGIYKDRLEKARTAAATYRDILGPDNFFLELQYQGLDEQKIVNRGLPGIARDLGLPMVCTNDVHYLREDDYKPHDILLCIGTGKSVNDADRLRYHGDQFFLKTPEAMAKIFAEFPDALANTVRIADRVDVNLASGVNHLPDFDVPAGFTVDTYFEHMVREGFAARLPRLQALMARNALRYTLDEYERRMVYEIAMIKQMKYAGYFLIVWDFIRFARENGIPVGPGRGSAAGSVVAWCLKITDVDPIEFDLIFERFLNPERVSLPDIDIDFCERRRGEVIDYVTRKYGRENVAQIITFGTMKAKAVVRDVGRVLDMPFADVDKVAKLIPPALDMTLDKALEESPGLKELFTRDPKVKELLDIGRRLEGMTRHASVHAAGVVIAPRPITEFAPLYKGKQDEITTQWAMKEIERVGLLKMDFLGLSTLTLLDDALAELKRTDGIAIDLERAAAERRGRARRRGQGARAQGLPAVLRGPHRRRLPVRVVGHARDAAQGQAAALRRPDRAERALSARPAAGRGRRRLHRPQARARRHQVRGQEARAGPARHLRGDRLPGAGHAHRARPRRLLDGRSGSAAQGHGQEGSQGHGQDARALRGRLGRARAAGEEGHQDLRPDGVLRRVRLQQVALDDLRAAGLPDRLPEGQPSAPLHGGAADDRVAEHRQAGLLPGRVPRHGRHGARAGHQCQRPAVHGRSPAAASASAWPRSRTSAKARSSRCWRRARPTGRSAPSRCSASTSTCGW